MNLYRFKKNVYQKFYEPEQKAGTLFFIKKRCFDPGEGEKAQLDGFFFDGEPMDPYNLVYFNDLEEVEVSCLGDLLKSPLQIEILKHLKSRSRVRYIRDSVNNLLKKYEIAYYVKPCEIREYLNKEEA